MAAIKGKDTKPEQYIRHELFSRGYRYRKNVNYIEGHPDLFLRKYNTAIFVHGCFWHRHENCKYAYMPKSRVDFWQKKFNDNQERDRFVQAKLKNEGIKCLLIWECTVKKMRKDESYRDRVLDEIESFLKSDKTFAQY
jgi:DNA mismatch endonuclease (patch repair protein)